MQVICMCIQYCSQVGKPDPTKAPAPAQNTPAPKISCPHRSPPAPSAGAPCGRPWKRGKLYAYAIEGVYIDFLTMQGHPIGVE